MQHGNVTRSLTATAMTECELVYLGLAEIQELESLGHSGYHSLYAISGWSEPMDMMHPYETPY
jgi:hypothetical protein